jgi:hypothetical protein
MIPIAGSDAGPLRHRHWVRIFVSPPLASDRVHLINLTDSLNKLLDRG